MLATDTPIECETDLSPHVWWWLRERGLCVHGEVAVYGRSVVLDHVGHAGPCRDPSDVVVVEMKRGAGRALRRQLGRLYRRNVVDEAWGAVWAEPRPATLEAWRNRFDDGGAWWSSASPGLVVRRDGRFETVFEPHAPADEADANLDRLLLIEANRGATGGVSSDDTPPVTHWSYVRRRIRRWASDRDAFTTQACWEGVMGGGDPDDPDLARAIAPYDSPRQLMLKVLRVMAGREHDRRDGPPTLHHRGRSGRYTLYETREAT